MAKLLIDDTRVLLASATAEGWRVLRKGEDLPEWIDSHGWPEAIALDYDLRLAGGTWDGGRVAVWLRNAFLETGRPQSEFPLWDAHSSVASCNAEIEETLALYVEQRRPGLAPIKRS